jgi:hypothetical protein
MMEKTKASFQVEIPLWHAFRKKCFDAGISASAKLRQFVKEEVKN